MDIIEEPLSFFFFLVESKRADGWSARMLINLEFQLTVVVAFLQLYLPPFQLERLNSRQLDNWRLANIFEITGQ